MKEPDLEPPTITCVNCGRKRDATLHMRAELPPDAARKWLRKTCKHEEKPCDFGYRAGVDTEGLRRALSERKNER